MKRVVSVSLGLMVVWMFFGSCNCWEAVVTYVVASLAVSR